MNVFISIMIFPSPYSKPDPLIFMGMYVCMCVHETIHLDAENVGERLHLLTFLTFSCVGVPLGSLLGPRVKNLSL